MPIRPLPQFKAVPDKMLEIPQPAIGGLNLKDIEFEQDISQSPYMLNVMYRNGAFGKRYGQEYHSDYEGEVYASVYFGGDIYVHAGSKIYKYAQGAKTEVGDNMPLKSGLFIIFAQKLYYLISSGFYELKSTFELIDAYVPTLLINCAPDGMNGADTIEQLNVLGSKFKISYNGDNTTNVYQVGPYDGDETLKIIDWSCDPKVWVDDEELTLGTDFTVNQGNKTITFTVTPPEGAMNVEMEFTLLDTLFTDERDEILGCRFYETFGGSNNSRLFLAGGGNSKYFYSQAYDISYFPETNYASLGNTEDDITGFGRQYNVLIVFKPREIYSIYSYTETSSTTIIEENIGMEGFRSQLVNARIGCDAPYSIQLINNLLTWFNSNEGICTLVSTNIQDERNVRTISRNVDRTNNFGVKGMLDYDEDPFTLQSADYDGKYFLAFPQSGVCFMWDYAISPYHCSSNGETNPRNLSWFLFDNFYVKQFLKVGKDLLFSGCFDGLIEYTVKQRVANGNFEDESAWMVHTESTQFWTENNVGYLTISRINDGIKQLVPVDCGVPYYVSAEIKNTSPVTIGLWAGNSNEFVRKSVIMTYHDDLDPDAPTTFMPLCIQIDQDLPEPFTIEARNVMMVRMDDFIGSVTKADLDAIDYIDDDYKFVYGRNTYNNLIKLNNTFTDLDGDAIRSFYMTPFLQFGAVEYLKNIKNLYIQCRGDTNTIINISYYTDDSADPEREPEPINVSGGNGLWSSFQWESFGWYMNIWGNTFRRKCNLKKVQMASIFFENYEPEKDMSITHIGMQYQVVKNVR